MNSSDMREVWKRLTGEGKILATYPPNGGMSNGKAFGKEFSHPPVSCCGVTWNKVVRVSYGSAMQGMSL